MRGSPRRRDHCPGIPVTAASVPARAFLLARLATPCTIRASAVGPRAVAGSASHPPRHGAVASTTSLCNRAMAGRPCRSPAMAPLAISARRRAHSNATLPGKRERVGGLVPGRVCRGGARLVSVADRTRVLPEFRPAVFALSQLLLYGIRG